MRDVITRRLAAQPNSFNRETRTFTAVIATGAPIGGVRIDLDGLVIPDGVPVMLDHDTRALSTVGRVARTWREGNALLAEIRLSGDPSLAPLVERIADGTIASVSIGFRVVEWGRPEGNVRVARRAELIEVSIVSVPADARATVRSGVMDDEDVHEDEATPPQPDEREVRRTRRRDRRTQLRGLGISGTAADALVDEEDDGEFNRLALAALQQRCGRTIRTEHRAADDFATPATAALVSLMGGEEPADAFARSLAAGGTVGVMREFLRRGGVSVSGLTPDEVIRRSAAMSTSDLSFLGIYDNAAARVVTDRYRALASPTGVLFSRRTAPDFKEQAEAGIDWTTLIPHIKREGGEIRASYVSEDGARYRLITHAARTGATREAILNSSTALANMGLLLGRAMAAHIDVERARFIEQSSGAGPVLADGVAMFHASRGNIVALNVSSIEAVINGVLAARATMPKRRGAGTVPIGASPAYWLVSPGFEPTALRALAVIAPGTAGAVNPLAGKLELIVDPYLTADNRSWLVAAPSRIDGLVEVSLAGAGGPVVESRWDFATDVLETKIRLDRAFAALDWRGWTRLDHA